MAEGATVALATAATGEVVAWVSGTLPAGVIADVEDVWLLRRDDRPGAAMDVFRVSIYYLALVFIAIAADQLLLG